MEKLLRHGSGWLPAHPEREPITQRLEAVVAALRESSDCMGSPQRLKGVTVRFIRAADIVTGAPVGR